MQVLPHADAEQILHLARHAGDVRTGHVHLVENGHDLQMVVDRQIGVGHGLGLHSLRRVDDEDGTLAGAHAARDLVGEVHVARSVDQVEAVGLAITRGVEHRDGMALDGDAALALELHRVEGLVAYQPLLDGLGQLQDAV